MGKRRYQQRRRAEQQAETRARIVDATVALHEELGPLSTTVKAIAERAGVERLTVYRHFPDDAALFGACSARFLALRPPPDSAAWHGVEEPDKRIRAALRALYGYYRDNRQMLGNVLRDAEVSPALKAHTEAFTDYLERIRDDLVRHRCGGRPTRACRITLGHAVRFTTWQSLHAEGLDESRMAALVIEWLAGRYSG